MMKSKLATILAVPAGAVWAVDTLIVNMPRVMEGGLLVAGIGVALVGWEGCRRLIHSATADQAPAPLEQAQERHPAGSALPSDPFALPSDRARAALEQAFLMGAAAAQEQAPRVQAQPASVRRIER